MEKKIKIDELAASLAKVETHNFYRRLSFLLTDKNFDEATVNQLYHHEDDNGNLVMNEEAEALFMKNYVFYLEIINNNQA